MSKRMEFDFLTTDQKKTFIALLCGSMNNIDEHDVNELKKVTDRMDDVDLIKYAFLGYSLSIMAKEMGDSLENDNQEYKIVG